MTKVSEITSQAIADMIEYYKPVGGKISEMDDKIGNLSNVKVYAAMPPYNVSANSNDQTSGIQAALDYAYNNGGGTVVLPKGILLVTSLTKNWTASTTVNIEGAGKKATILSKFGATTTPIINFSASGTVLETYSDISDLSILGNTKTHDGIQIDSCARFSINNVDISSCNNAIKNLGGLVFSIDHCTLHDNNVGFYSRKSTTTNIYCNLITISRSQIVANTSFGIDYDEGNSLIIDQGTNIESNGTATNINTGGVKIGANATLETGIANIIIDKCWFELNKGRSIQAFSGDITINATEVYDNEAGDAVYIDGCTSFRMEDSQVPNNTVRILSTTQRVLIGNSTIQSIVNNASAQNSLIYNTGGGTLARGGYTSDVYINEGHKLALTWANGSGISTIENNTITGDLEFTPHASGRFKKKTYFNAGIGFDIPIAAASAPNGTLFKDSADNKLKYKDDTGTVNLLY